MSIEAHIFNPTCEMEVANGEVSYMPPVYLQKFTEDLEMLPLVYAKPNDCVLLRQPPDLQHIERLRMAGFDLPSFLLLSEIKSLSKEYKPRPWGWSPAIVKQLKTLEAVWNSELKPFFSRQFSLNILQQLLQNNLPRVIDSNKTARYANSLSEVENLLLQWGRAVIKAPYSSSGRGVQILRNSQLNVNIINRTRSIIAAQGGVMVEPYYDKICDFAYEFKIVDGVISFAGYSSFLTNENGQYEGHVLPFNPNNFSKEAANLWNIGVVNAALEELLPILQNSGIAALYEGYFGVDALIFRDSDGSVRLQPCLEINLRNNMGIVALHLEKHIADYSICEFKIISNTSVSLTIFDKDFTVKYPLVMEGSKIVSGYLPITPPAENAQTMAYLLVSSNQ